MKTKIKYVTKRIKKNSRYKRPKKNKIHKNKLSKALLILFLSTLYFIPYSKNDLNALKDLNDYGIKICLCTVAKQENKYLREFVEFYKNYGVDKIYLYDNNLENGERFDEVISDYITSNFVEVIDRRGKIRELINILNDCYRNNKDNYDWLIFYEIDEYIYLKNFKNIKPFLNQQYFNTCKIISLNWVHHSDNGKLHYENKSVQERFPKNGRNVNPNIYNRLADVKSIARGHLQDLTIGNGHYLTNQYHPCNGYGKPLKLHNLLTLEPDYENYYVIHYFTKSLEEFVEKIKRGDVYKGPGNKDFYMFQIDRYFEINELTKEKLDYIEEKLGKEVDLTEYRKRLNQSNS